MYFEIAISGIPLRKTFLYESPQALPPGTRVLVDFAGRKTIGYVISKGKPYEGLNIKRIIKPIDEIPLLKDEDVELAVRVSEEFLSPIGKIMDLFFSGATHTSRLILIAHDEKFRFIEYLKRFPVTHVLRDLRDGVVSLELATRQPKTKKKFVKLSASIEELSRQRLSKNQKNVINYMLLKGSEELDMLIQRTMVSRQTIYTLVKRGILTLWEEETKDEWVLKKDVELTNTQQRIVENILEDPGTPHLIMGVTGSGKTEVYLEIIRRLLEKGGTALITVPEIALTPQTVARVKGKLKGLEVKVYHSSVPSTERARVWWQSLAGRKMVVVGTRSAVWLPFSNLKIIVMDEEHDESYYQETDPVYDAVRVSELRHEIMGVPLILVSATPKVTHYHKTLTGSWKLHTLTERPVGEKPHVEVVDLRTQKKEQRILSPRLSQEIEEILHKNKQALILTVRKGFANYMVCGCCGHVFKCERCDVSLTYHRNTNLLKCHHCGYVQNLPSRCPNCGSFNLLARGFGTEKVELEILRRFPAARVMRFDKETVGSYAEIEEMVKNIVEKRCDVVVGTRIISKGIDAPDVEMVAVLDADRNLSITSYSANENLFQLLVQVTGRSGRGGAGRAFIQTFEPENTIIEAVVEGKYEKFFEDELARRKLFDYPPFARLIRVMALSENRELAFSFLEDLKKDLGIESLGPVEAPIPKIKNKHRIQLLIKVKEEMARITEILKNKLNTRSGQIDIKVFVDPPGTFP